MLITWDNHNNAIVKKKNTTILRVPNHGLAHVLAPTHHFPPLDKKNRAYLTTLPERGLIFAFAPFCIFPAFPPATPDKGRSAAIFLPAFVPVVSCLLSTPAAVECTEVLGIVLVDDVPAEAVLKDEGADGGLTVFCNCVFVDVCVCVCFYVCMYHL